MAFEQKFIDYGVVTVSEYGHVKIHAADGDSRVIVWDEGVDASWSGSAVIVQAKSGSLRRYTDSGKYTVIHY